MNDTLSLLGLTTTPLELLSFVLALANVWLNIRQNHWAWLFAIVSSATYAGVFFSSRLYGDVGLQFVFIIASLWGWYKWLSGSRAERKLRLSHLPPLAMIICGIGWLAAFGLLSLFLKYYTNTDVPYADGFLTAGSLIGTLLLSNKKIENWHVWIVVDVLYIALYTYKHLWLTALLYGVFVLMALAGLRAWTKDLDYDSLTPVDLRGL
jgi:nicotinamide mononucleotide transporter